MTLLSMSKMSTMMNEQLSYTREKFSLNMNTILQNALNGLLTSKEERMYLLDQISRPLRKLRGTLKALQKGRYRNFTYFLNAL